jgi:hypothetical protein
MKITAASAVPLAVILFFTGCRTRLARPPDPGPPAAGKSAAPAAPAAPADDAPLAPSPRLIVGRITAVDAARGFAFVELAAEAPAIALVADTELIARTLDLRETARLRASRYLRGRMLGTNVARGRPRVGDEVVWLAP